MTEANISARFHHLPHRICGYTCITKNASEIVSLILVTGVPLGQSFVFRMR
jgi:hypothetical protein